MGAGFAAITGAAKTVVLAAGVCLTTARVATGLAGFVTVGRA